MLETIGATGLYAIIGVITLAVASLLGLVLFASKEETFEDVVAAQKKKQEALLNSLQSSNKGGKSNKKWTKLKNKKASKKDNEDGEVDSGVDDDEPSSESVAVAPPKPIAVEPTVQQKKTKTDQKEEAVAEAVKEPQKLKTEKQKKQKKVKEPKKIVEEDVVIQSEQVVVESGKSGPDREEIITTSEEISVNSPNPSVLQELATESTTQKKNKAGKAKQAKHSDVKKNKEASGLSAEKLIKDIQGAHLNSGEVQQVIDSLLAKQNESEQWKKPNQKGDPIEVLNKRISELDIQVTEERKTAQSAAHKNKELRNELARERSQRQSIEAQAAGRINQQTKENEALRKHMEEKHVSEMQSAQAQIQRMQELIDGVSHMELQRLKDENNHLKNASMRAQQLSEDKKSLMNELGQLQQGNKQLRQDMENSHIKYKQLEQQHISMQDKVSYYENEINNSQRAKADTEGALNQRLNEVNDKLLQVEAINCNLNKELQIAKRESDKSKKEYETLVQKSPNSNQVSELNNQLSQAGAKLSKLESDLKAAEAQLQTKDDQVKKYQVDLTESQKKLVEKENLLSSADQSNEKDKRISELTQKVMELEAANDSLKSAKDSTQGSESDKVKELEVQLKQNADSQKALQESVDTLKAKNNELREKNWKAVDALGKSEEESKKKQKELEKSLMKGLKQLHPDVKIPSHDGDLDALFVNYEQNLKAQADKPNKELDDTKAENEALKKEIEELKSKTVVEQSSEDLSKIQAESAHLKSVLADTESMLSRLQAGVDAEVAKWQKKVEDKDGELEDANKKVADLEEVLKEHGFQKEEASQMEETLKESQSENAKLKTDKLNLEQQLKSAQKDLEAAKKEAEKSAESSNEVTDLNAKLKKTISERDLLIREYKAMKDTKTSLETNLKKATQDAKTNTETHQKEIKKLKDQLTAAENTSKSSGKSDKEKDKLIGKLYLEIEELKEDLREERDRVIVDIETPDSEELHKQVDELISEKQNLSLKLNDLEKSFQEEQSDKDKLLNLESKLKAAEARVQELESQQNTRIESQISDAMQQAAGTTV
ncbi:ribosome-binding protein 1-like isoform X2 [Hydractinia symbiolongicarpus]|uniref:ribosome-binding protein 1-like isoform X2 n=1 Tax=Hydractinia symbiolongicarpus TaxID=13093 RepID=UPI00254CB88A|nr:ribosome-binding protein 1-like isoform X2 [Hydractinia symbiolongicarpus]